MLIGLDFDNTIVCYDQAIAELAAEQLNIPASIDRTKQGVRDFLRQENREDEWTAFQGHLYGPGIARAVPFPNAIEVIGDLRSAGHRTVIISHKTRYPYAGPKHDLHAAARGWIKTHLTASGTALFSDDDILLNETKDDKVDVIRTLGCDVFLDDLPEILSHPAFPDQSRPILFAPAGSEMEHPFTVVSSWQEFRSLCPG